MSTVVAKAYLGRGQVVDLIDYRDRLRSWGWRLRQDAVVIAVGEPQGFPADAQTAALVVLHRRYRLDITGVTWHRLPAAEDAPLLPCVGFS